MTFLLILALLVLLAVFAVFFLIFKVIWLIFKKNTHTGPLIAAGVCTVCFSLAVGVGIYGAYQAITAPFKTLVKSVKQNPTPLYGSRIYTDDKFPFKLTVYNGMEFSKWISLGGLDLKIGVDTNAFKKDAAGKTPQDILIGAVVRQSAIDDADPLQVIQSQLQTAQAQRRLTLSGEQRTTLNNLPAYQAWGEAYSNRGKLNFWLTAVQTDASTLYYIGALSTADTPALQEQAANMVNSFQWTALPQ
ncbi:MAG: hypothetical protein IKW71_00675 [Elusimicrobiaceae bacterium]|nr:hypothetical protein [Elusimicrobiaceae bacterium]